MLSPTFVIIDNEFRGAPGAAAGTAVAVAAAARAAGYRTILAVHVDSPARDVPEWLDVYPVFRTDFRMDGPPAAAADLGGIRGDAVALRRVPVEAVVAGTATIREFLLARFDEPFGLEPGSEHVPDDPPGERPPDLPPRAEFFRAEPSRAESSRAERLRSAGRALIPPVLLPGLRQVIRSRGPLCARVAAFLREFTPPVVYAGLVRLLTGLRSRWAAPGCGRDAGPTDMTRPAGDAPELPGTDAAEPAALPPWEPACGPDEVSRAAVFEEDLCRVMCLSGIDARGHIFQPTAHPREVLAVSRLLGPGTLPDPPTVHLQFRHRAVFAGGETGGGEGRLLQACFDALRAGPRQPRLRLWTDSEALTHDYQMLAGVPFRTLPAPHRAAAGPLKERQPVDLPLRLGFHAEFTRETGVHRLPHLARALRDEYFRRGRTRLLLHGCIPDRETDPRVTAALNELKMVPVDHLTLVPEDEPPVPSACSPVAAGFDVLLCPFDAPTYEHRASATFWEAVEAGVPTVVPRGTWLARVQPPGSGETFADLPSFIEAVRRVCDRHGFYAGNARAWRNRRAADHRPAELVAALTRADTGAEGVSPVAPAPGQAAA